MFRSTLRKLTKSLTSTPRRPLARRASLSVEGLEDRTVLSTASLVGSTLVVNADPGFAVFGLPGKPGFKHVRQITFQADKAHPGKLDVTDNGVLLGGHPFAISAIKSVSVSLASLDAVNIEDSNGLPFAAGTSVSLFGNSNIAFLANSLNLSGSRVIGGGETYAAGNGAQAASLTLGGITFQFNSTIPSVSDTVKTTAPLIVKAFGQSVSLDGQNGVTQTLSGLAGGGGAGSTLTYSNKNLVNLEMFSANASATLNATAAATGEHFFVVDLFATNQGVQINATPGTVDTSVVDAGQGDAVRLEGNAGRVFVNGTVSTFVTLGSAAQFGVTAGIKRDVFVSGAGRLAVFDVGNHTTQEHVTVTESAIKATGLFGNNAVTVHYSNVQDLEFGTGKLAATYTVIGSHPGARFGAGIEINDNSTVGMNVLAALDAGSGLNLALLNQDPVHIAPASLFVSAVNGKFNPSVPATPSGTATVTFAGGLTSFLSWIGFTSVTHS